MSIANQIQKYSSLSLSKVENRLAIIDKLLSTFHIKQLKKNWQEKLYILKRKGKWQELFVETNNCIIQFPDWEYGYYMRGNAEREKKDYKGAIEDYNKTIGLASDFVKAYTERGFTKSKLGDFQGEIEDYNIAIMLDNENADAYVFRGVAKALLGNYESAEEDLNKAEQLESSRFNILLIDDDENLVQLLQEEFPEKNYCVDYAFRGEEGLETLKLLKYHLVILGLKMPGMQGEEVLVNIKKYYPSIPVIVLTAVSDPKIAPECFKNGADVIMSKPFEFDELLKTVKSLLDKYKLKQKGEE